VGDLKTNSLLLNIDRVTLNTKLNDEIDTSAIVQQLSQEAASQRCSSSDVFWCCSLPNTDSLEFVKSENYRHCEEKKTAVCQWALLDLLTYLLTYLLAYSLHGAESFLRS
jgi:hypothetical protein